MTRGEGGVKNLKMEVTSFVNGPLSKILKIVVPFWPLFVYVDYYQINQFYRIKIDFLKISVNGTTIFNIFDNTTEFWITKYIIGEIFSSGGATLYKNPSDQTVLGFLCYNRFIDLCCCLGSLSFNNRFTRQLPFDNYW